jgi:hypothetical protein
MNINPSEVANLPLAQSISGEDGEPGRGRKLPGHGQTSMEPPPGSDKGVFMGFFRGPAAPRRGCHGPHEGFRVFGTILCHTTVFMKGPYDRVPRVRIHM